MNIYKSPLYPALMIRLPGEGRRNVKASGGRFNVASDDVAAFEEFIAQRPHYKIELVGTQEDLPEITGTITADEAGTGTLQTSPADVDAVTQPEPMSESELAPEKVTVESLETLNVPVLRERLQGLGLPDDGRKAVLVKRLSDALAEKAAETEEQANAAATADDTTNDADAPDTAE